MKPAVDSLRMVLVFCELERISMTEEYHATRYPMIQGSAMESFNKAQFYLPSRIPAFRAV
jgi:hypothetical protein